MDKTKPLIILITMGDPAGSGPELVLKSLTHRDLWRTARYVVVGDLGVLMKAREITKSYDIVLKEISSIDETASFRELEVGVVNLGNVDLKRLEYGKPSEIGGKASYEYIVKAVELLMKGEAAALVTAPISKESLHLAGYRYPGHTELLAELSGVKTVKMMLVARHLRVSHVSTHVSLRRAIELVTKHNVLETITMTHEALVRLFKIANPRIAVSGLNPHAGESGIMGHEEASEIEPAVEEARMRGINAQGPFPPDTVFYRAYYNREFDAVIAMYHDQGHIAVKMVGFAEGVNLTLGLPFIRTSPDHGTAWDKAGKGTANESAAVEAIRLAMNLASSLILQDKV
ncbi:4-hydroxythreonine-4-phosphate dehydrogenase [Desulfurococcaceae archaeon AG1]|nr:4-hydroxythreonine-4-phosphate dehydrogenase [Desulfurococcaceae archaeon AG1]